MQYNRYYVDQRKPLTNFEKLVILLEDRRFFEHKGIDLKSVCREAIRAFTFQRFGGSSTIDMQLFRTSCGRYERTLRRKVREFVGAYALQSKFNKIEILRFYLRIAYFGTGLIGAESAAYDQFQKSSDDLTIQEAAFLASMLVYPKPRL